jgi:16S rRNA (guanine1516-N2)-methyltransferase
LQLQLLAIEAEKQPLLDEIAKSWGIEHTNHGIFALVLTETRLELRKLDEPRLGAIYVDFVGGAAGHRRKFGGGKGQAIAKAIGLGRGKGAVPVVLDATAGLGRDAFVMASLGCQVVMIERHPVIAALLEDGLKRATQDDDIGSWVSDRMTLIHDSSIRTITNQRHNIRPDVIYLDPMYPHPPQKKKKALVKKEMRVFQSLIGDDADADELLEPALHLATKRVVVKRPDYADWLNLQPPTMSLKTKKNRFDVYVKAAMTVVESK